MNTFIMDLVYSGRTRQRHPPPSPLEMLTYSTSGDEEEEEEAVEQGANKATVERVGSPMATQRVLYMAAAQRKCW